MVFFIRQNVLLNIVDLLKILRKPLEPYEVFLLLSAGLVHDFGMFVRLVEGNVETQRKFHGRLAEIILGNLLTEADGAQKVGLKLIDVWYIGTIARLHQTKEFKNYIEAMGLDLRNKEPDPTADENHESSRALLTYEKIAELGGILLLADGLDIIQGRANHKIYKAFQKVIGQVNPSSSAEWLTNSLVLKYKIKVINKSRIRVDYLVDISEVSEKLNLAISESKSSFKTNVAEYFMSLLWRYLYDGHFKSFKKIFTHAELEIKLYDEKREYNKSSVGGSLARIQTSINTTRLTYNKEWQFWYEGLANLNLGEELWGELQYLTTNLNCDHCFILVKDSLRSSLRIFIPADFLKNSLVQAYIKNVSWREKNFRPPRKDSKSEEEYKKDREEYIQKQFHYDCLKARVPEKFSVAGHVWYRGLPEVINFGETNEGRMMADELDLSLGLKALYYHPYITEEVIDRKVKKTLHFVLVFNKRKYLDDVTLGALQNHCINAWKAYFRGESGINCLPVNKVDIPAQMDKVCNMLKERLFLGHPIVKDL